MGKFPGNELHPLHNDWAGNLGRKAIFCLFQLHEMGELVDAYVAAIGRIIETREK